MHPFRLLAFVNSFSASGVDGFFLSTSPMHFMTAHNFMNSAEFLGCSDQNSVTPYTCKICGSDFSSRNILFRHIRKEHDDSWHRAQENRQSVIIHFGCNASSSATASKLLNILPFPEILGSTQASVAKARPFALGDVNGTPVAEDVFILNFQGPDHWEDTVEIPNALDNIRIHGWRNLGGDSTLHAENSCTQHIFRYLLPVDWLPDADDIKLWYETGQPRPSPPILRSFKDILRTFESSHVSQRGTRFGALAHKERRCFHNYANPKLAGAISPHKDVVLRSVDRARFLDVIKHANGDYFLICEFKGDDFLQEQVQRMVGTAVGMVHGWLPDNFIELSMDRTKIIETPVAPSEFLFRAGVRFHFAEQYYNGQTLLNADDVHKLHNDNPVEWMQNQLLSKEQQIPIEWFINLQTIVAPRIQLQLSQESLPNMSLTKLSQPPDIYIPVLKLLRDMVQQNKWPTTSAARSTVLKTTDGGSFTVVNTDAFDVSILQQLPQANEAFPQLTKAVFELEGILNATTTNGRPPSSHCAINCNAQFTPHVDSGRGTGQSVSMIVGLGDYVGGELMVENISHDIRYSALEFDGWNLRHWTQPFVGERFSLVWFTPEGMTTKLSE